MAIAALFVCLVIGCSQPAGSSSSEKEYTVKYGGETVKTLSEKEYQSYAEQLEKGTDYTIDGTTITLKESGASKLGLGSDHHDGETGHGGDNHNNNNGGSGNGGNNNNNNGGPGQNSEEAYLFEYNSQPVVFTVLENKFPAMKSDAGFIEGDDYSIDGTKIILTASGYEKLTQFIQGFGVDPEVTYTLKLPDGDIAPARGDLFVSSIMTYGFEEGTDYTISGTTITMTEAGIAKWRM